MEMRFTAQGEQGDDGKDIEYYFKGDDDVLVYIDDVLFLELAGTHRQVGGNINFTKGIVTYYDFDKNGFFSVPAEELRPLSRLLRKQMEILN